MKFKKVASFQQAIEIIINNTKDDFTCPVIDKEQILEPDFNSGYTVKALIDKYNKTVSHDNHVMIFAKDQTSDFLWNVYYFASAFSYPVYLYRYEVDIEYVIINRNVQTAMIVSDSKDVNLGITMFLASIQDKLRQENRFFCYSFLVGRDKKSLLNLLSRIILAPTRDIRPQHFLVNHFSHEDKSDIECKDLRYIEYDIANVDHIKHIFEQKDAITSYIGHGREDCFILNDGVICGKRISSYLKSVKKGPVCSCSDRCFLIGIKEKLPFHKSMNRHIFVNSCNSSILSEGVFTTDFSLMYNAIDSKLISFIGSPTVVNSKLFLNAYYHAQMMCGRKLGEIIVNLNEVMCMYSLGTNYSYCLIGNAEYNEPAVAGTISYDISMHVGQGFSNIFEINIQDNVSIVNIILPKEYATQFFGNNIFITANNENGDNLFGVFRIKDGHAFLEIFTGGIIGKGKLILKISRNYSIYYTTVISLEKIIIFGITPSQKYKTTLAEYKQLALKLSKCKNEFLANLSKIQNRVYNKLELMKSKEDLLVQLLITYFNERINKKGFSWEEHCLENGLDYKYTILDDEERKCSNCGNTVNIVVYQHPMYDHIITHYTICPLCGIVKTCPEVLLGRIKFDYLENYTNENELNAIYQEVLIENISEINISGIMCVAVIHGEKNDFSYDSPIQRIALGPGENNTYTFKIITGENTMPHNYWLRCIIIANGEICTLKKDIWVSGERSDLE